MNPDVSVVITTYNRSNYLIKSLESVINKTYKNIEILVIDDGSTDNTSEIMENIQKKFCDTVEIKYIRLEKNQGVSKARNVGILNAKGKYIKFLDDDDILYPWAIEKLYMFAEEKELDLVYSNLFIYKSSEGILKYIRFSSPPQKPLDLLFFLEYSPITISSSISKKNAIINAGLFDEKLLLAEDWDLWYRMLLKDYKFEYIDIPSSVYTIHEKIQPKTK